MPESILHDFAWKTRRFRYDPSWHKDMPEKCISGIYLLFEDGEVFENGDRLVRVGPILEQTIS